MTPETAINVVHKIMASPSEIIKIEFQGGGEPLLNFEVVKTIVREAKKLNRQKHKNLYFVLCTNLTLIDAPILAYCKKEGVSLSTSLDGPKEIHDRHRIMRTGEGSYDRFIQNLRLSRSILGHEGVNPMMTATKEGLSHFTEIIDEYAALGFEGIFLRHVNPYGYAQSDEHRQSFAYDMEEFVEAYKKALRQLQPGQGEPIPNDCRGGNSLEEVVQEGKTNWGTYQPPRKLFQNAAPGYRPG